MTIIIDLGIGNLGSIRNMIRKAGGEVEVSSDPDIIASAKKLILPGVGSFDRAMKKLTTSGLDKILNKRVLEDRVPILGICLGMQLFAQSSEEGILPGLGWLDSRVIRFRLLRDALTSIDTNLKIPHMGWNNITANQNSPLFCGLEEESRFYFVHSYHLECYNHNDILSTTLYGYDFPSAVIKGNIMGVQFHPEKSHKFGLRLIKNFVEMV